MRTNKEDTILVCVHAFGREQKKQQNNTQVRYHGVTATSGEPAHAFLPTPRTSGRNRSKGILFGGIRINALRTLVFFAHVNRYMFPYQFGSLFVVQVT